MGRRHKSQLTVGTSGPSFSRVASKFADYAVSVLEGTDLGGEGNTGAAQQQTPVTVPRPSRSALDVLRWNAGAAVGVAVRRAKRQKIDDKSQMYLDFGQRNFYNTKCTICNMCYCPGLASDEKLHDEFHKRVTQGILYKGFKNQNAVHSWPDGSYIVCIRQNDPAPQIAKADEVRKMAERDLGGFEGAYEQCSVIFLWISPERRAAGFLLAEPIRRAYRIVTPARQEARRLSPTPQECLASHGSIDMTVAYDSAGKVAAVGECPASHCGGRNASSPGTNRSPRCCRSAGRRPDPTRWVAARH